MKYALIGCGRISPNHIEAAKNNKLDFVAMCDIVPEVMAEKSEKFGLEHVKKYTDYKELLAKEQPELVAIATESGKHCGRGKKVICLRGKISAARCSGDGPGRLFSVADPAAVYAGPQGFGGCGLQHALSEGLL